MIILLLLTKMTACSAILYGYYWAFLRNKRFHHYNRFYLLAATGLSITIPFIKIPVFFEPHTSTGQIMNRSVEIISVNHWEDEFAEPSAPGIFSSWFTFQTASMVCYGLIILVLLYFFTRSLLYIHTLSKKYPFEYINALKFYNTTEPGTPFSFFRSIFWNSRIDFNSREGQQIFRHELFHVKQRHSSDIIFLELASIVFWINPFFHLIRKEIKTIHEFLADQHAMAGNSRQDYAELLILHSISSKRSALANYFFQNHLKRRIAMITQFKNKKYSYWNRLMVLPLSILLFCAVALYAQNPKLSSVEKEVSAKAPQILPEAITVLVDAGHGGKDFGVKSDDGLLEKDLTLAIARQIKQHASSYNIKVVMTRDADVYPAIKDRAQMATTLKADLVIAVHVAGEAKMKTNAVESPDPLKGFDIFVTNKNEKTVGQSKVLGQEISKQISKFYTVGAIKQRKENGIWMLDAVPCPAVLIECGYITNETDVAFISKTENQEKIAQSILKGIVNYKSAEQSNLTTFVPSSNTGKQSKPGKFVIDDGSFIQELQRQYMKNLTIPETSTLTNEGTSIYFSIDIGTNGEVTNFISYEQKPAISNPDYYGEIVVVGLPKRLPLSDGSKVDLPENNGEAAFIAEAKKATEKLRVSKKSTPVKPGKYFFKVLFKIEKNQEILTDGEISMKMTMTTRDQDTLPKKTSSPLFTKVEVEPAYPGGADGWRAYLKKSFRYPIEAKEKNISGAVVVQFIVDKDGRLSEIEAISGPNELRAESEKIIRESGNWIPARQNGHTVNAYKKQPVNFKIEK